MGEIRKRYFVIDWGFTRLKLWSLNQDKKLAFKQSGYLLEKGLFKQSEAVIFEQEFDKIISQLKKSGENINARWRSGLTKKLESQKSKVIHTHNVQSFSSIMLDMVKNKNLLKIAEALIGPDIILHHTKLFLKPLPLTLATSIEASKAI